MAFGSNISHESQKIFSQKSSKEPFDRIICLCECKVCTFVECQSRLIALVGVDGVDGMGVSVRRAKVNQWMPNKCLCNI